MCRFGLGDTINNESFMLFVDRRAGLQYYKIEFGWKTYSYFANKGMIKCYIKFLC